jgi:mono/diheme cytochrome c family protein
MIGRGIRGAGGGIARQLTVFVVLVAASQGHGTGSARAADPLAPAVSAPRSHYLLGCGGCHGYQGVSNSKRVPTLQGLVGYYLSFPAGRAYLPRLPNVAFANLDDEQLAGVLNYLVFDLGAGSAPAGARPYTAQEVGRLRKTPLTEVSLLEVRRRLVDTLIARYGAPAALREYGDEPY